jgi:hypothetical protein
LDELSAETLTERAEQAGLGREIPVYLTCHSGARAFQAAQRLADAGLPNTVVIEGGTEAWERAGLPMRRCGGAMPLERQVQIALGLLLLLKVLFGYTVHELFFAAGALIGSGLIIAGLTRWCGLARLLALMPWNRDHKCPGEVPA